MAEPARPTPAPRRDLDALAAHHRLGVPALEVLFDLAAARPGRAEDARFLRRALGLGGVLSLAAGVIFFVAANWAVLGTAGRFALLQGLLVAAGAAAVVRPPPDRIGKLGLLGGFLLTGALLALFGQTYQTGADVYELFLAWAGLGLPVVVLSGSSAAWGAWVLVLDAALALLCGWLPGVHVLWTVLGELGFSAPALFAVATAVNLALWAACEAADGTRLAAVASPWLGRLVVGAAAGFGGWGAVTAIAFSDHPRGRAAPGGGLVLAVVLALAGAAVAWQTLRRRRDVFPVAAIAAVLIAVGTTLIIRGFDGHHDGLVLSLAVSLWLIGASTASGGVLMGLLRRWRAGGTLA
jgi:hypothetical protein